MRICRNRLRAGFALLAIAAVGVVASCGGSDDGDGFGRFRKVREVHARGELTRVQSEEIARLEALGYLAGVNEAAGGENGVLVHDPNRAQRGLNLYSSGHGPEALLIANDGTVVHRWHKDFAAIWPNRKPPARGDWFRRARALPDGSLLAVIEGMGLIKLDKDSNVVWAKAAAYHHDVNVAPDGRLVALSRKAHLVPRVSPDKPLSEHYIELLTADGDRLLRVSLIRAFENAAPEYRRFWDDRKRRFGDVLHANSVRVLDGRHADRMSAFAAGNVLVSLRNLDTVAVVDLAAKKVVWAARGMFRRQHDAELLDNGRVMLFDNRRMKRYSAVREFDPSTMLQKWAYRGGRDQPLFTLTCGASQRLSGGTTLITETDAGRAIEVTHSGEIVWEFLSPHRAGEDDQLIAALFDMQRYPPDYADGWANGGSIPTGDR